MNNTDPTIFVRGDGTRFNLYGSHGGCELDYVHVHLDRPLPESPKIAETYRWWKDDDLFWKFASIVCVVILLILFLH